MWPILTQLFNVEEDEDEEGSSVDGENVREIVKKKDVEGIVTKLQDFYGLIDDDILFNINVCSGLNLPVVGDRVRAKICKGRTSEYWRAMSVVKCTNFWEDYGEWGSNIYDPEIDEAAKNQLVARQEKRKAEMLYLEKLLKDKFGVEIVAEDFGCLEVSSKKSLIVELKNLGSETQTLISYHMVGLSQQMELGPLKINSISLKEQSKKIQETLPLIMYPGMVVGLTVICNAKHIGKESQMIVFDFSEFKIGKELTVDVTDPSLADEKREQFSHRKFDALDRMKRTRQEVKNREVVLVPGPKFADFSKGKKYYRAKLLNYDVPEELKDCILEGQDITRVVPCLRRPLNASNYEVRFKTLLHVEEVQQEVEMRSYDITEAEFEVDGMFLNLQVPGLSEGRPSLILGDRLMVSKNQNLLSGKVSYSGSVHQIRNDVLSLKFSSDFHADFDPTQKYSVTFKMNRGTLRRCHRAIELVSKFKGEVLFPQRVTLKPPLVDLILPGQGSSHANHNPRRSAGRMAKFFNQSLNRQQQLAVARILGGVARPLPYVIFGPPGTGKTITIVEAILQLLASRSRVRILACTPSNSAADLLTERLYETGQVSKSDMVRLCAVLRAEEAIPLNVRPFCSNVDDMDLTLEDKTVVICTCSTAGNLYEGTQTKQIVLFTHVFVDEAGQATEPECMIAVALAKVSSAQVILAGDPQQLGPVLRSSLAKEHGLDVSYLERLCSFPLYSRDLEKFGEYGGYDPLLITKLIDNYRCHPAIIGLSSCMFYDDELKVKGNLDLTNCLSSWYDLPNRNNFPILFHGVRGEDLREGNSPSWFNPHEVVLTIKYLKSLLMYDKYAVSPEDIGIITPYRKQVEKIRLMANSIDLPKVKVGSVEEFQGQERLAIIISTVRSSESLIDHDWKSSLGFLGNSKRFNVSITRAHSLLVVIGNPHILCQDVHWSSLIKYCIENDAYVGCNPPMFAADGCPLLENLPESSAELQETQSETVRDLESEAIKREQKEIFETVDEDDRDVVESFQDKQVIGQASDFDIATCNPLPSVSSSNNNTEDISYQTATSDDWGDDYVPPSPPPFEANGEVGDIPQLPPTTSEILPPSSSKTSDVTSDVVKESNEEVPAEVGAEGPMDDELMWKITRQMEYYFGEVNLRKDGFLLQRIAENLDGWVDIDVMMTFNKVKELQVTALDIVEALRQHSNVVEVSTDGLKLRRDPSRPIEADLEKWKEDMYQRSVVMRNYPNSETMERMQNYFAFYGPIVHIERNVLLKVWSNSKFYKMEKCDLILFNDHRSAKNLAKHKYTRLQKMGLELFFLDELVKQCLDFFVARRIENVSRPEAPSLRRGDGGFRGNQRGSRGRGYKASQPRNFQNNSHYGPSGHTGFSCQEGSSAWSSNYSKEFHNENRQSGVIINSDESDDDVVVVSNSHTEFKDDYDS